MIRSCIYTHAVTEEEKRPYAIGTTKGLLAASNNLHENGHSGSNNVQDYNFIILLRISPRFEKQEYVETTKHIRIRRDPCSVFFIFHFPDQFPNPFFIIGCFLDCQSNAIEAFYGGITFAGTARIFHV